MRSGWSMDDRYSSSSVRLNFLNNRWEKEESRVHLLPVALEETTRFRKGTRFSPAFILEASWELDDYEEEMNVDFATCPLYTENILVCRDGKMEDYIQSISKLVRSSLDMKAMPVLVGGEHTITLGGVKGCLEVKREINGVIFFDAHLDMYDLFYGNSLSHATVIRRVSEILGDVPLAVIGARTWGREEIDFALSKRNIHIWFSRGARSLNEFLSDFLKNVSSNVLLSVDLDVVDPLELPEVSNPAPLGIKIVDLLFAIKRIFLSKRVLYADVVEFCPSSQNSPYNLLAAFILKKILSFALKTLAET